VALWYTCPNCAGTGALRVPEGSGWRLETDARCNGRGTVTDIRPGDQLAGLPSPPYARLEAPDEMA